MIGQLLHAERVPAVGGQPRVRPDGLLSVAVIRPCASSAALKASHALGTLLSSKVNQWTLLVGTIPSVFALSATTFDGLPLDTNQRCELLITAAQSLFAVSVLVNLGLTMSGALTLFVLFSVQFTASITFPAQVNRWVIVVMSALYAVLAIGQFVRRRRRTVRIVRDGLVTPFEELEKAGAEQR